ncbi:hypothetical protein [Anatilimnocola floriformis]|uniref:hypothetical protein n=1 Tax=Anatilimnocola floriformis TaxID=2948575 RepID=UPI0020C5277E|nr:hypothetical protein [Anatilimnocola floriformis]
MKREEAAVLVSGRQDSSSQDVLAMHDGATARKDGSGSNVAAQPAAYYSAHPLLPILLVATAIFLIVVILARTPLVGYVVSQRVQASADRAATNTPLAPEQVATWLKSDAVLASTVQQVCPRDSLASQNQLIAALGSALQVLPHETAGNRAGWQLNLQYHDRQLASRLLNKLSESLTSQLKNLDQAETQLLVQHYQKVLAQARDEEDVARVALDRVRHEELTLAMQNNERTPPPVANVPLTTPVVKMNPAWVELKEKVDLAQAKLEQLLAARTAQHPQVIEAQTRLTTLLEQLDQTPREPTKIEMKLEEPKSPIPAPMLRGPEIPESARQPRRLVRQASSAGENAPNAAAALAKQIQQLSADWSTAAARRAAAETSYNDAQQQWVRGLNAEGWSTSAVWTHAQQGGRATPFQLLLAGILAVTGGLGVWQLGRLANRAGLLSDVFQLQENLPLPVIGEVPLATTEPKRMPTNLSVQVFRVSQFSFAVLLAVMIVCAWATTNDPNLGQQWTLDPLSTLGQAFDLLHRRVMG